MRRLATAVVAVVLALTAVGCAEQDDDDRDDCGQYDDDRDYEDDDD